MVPGQVVPVVMDVELPAGIAGPEPMSFDVRCFLVPRAGGIVLVDTGIDGDGTRIMNALTGMDADWGDLSDVVLTHAHPDHCGALSAVVAMAPSAAVWGGPGDRFPVTARAAEDGQLIHGLRVVATPGHTPGHLCLFDEVEGTVFTGDAVSSQGGRLSQGPPQFITDTELAARSLERLVGLRAERWCFGHGDEVGDTADALRSLVEA